MTIVRWAVALALATGGIAHAGDPGDAAQTGGHNGCRCGSKTQPGQYYHFETPHVCPLGGCPQIHGCQSSCRHGAACEDLAKKKRARCPRRIEGLDGLFNCGCQGSYKYPVPPLYTYHWPGMYAQQSVLEFSSPWRQPGLQPLLDTESLEATITPASTRPRTSRQPTSRPRTMSERMQAMR